jgi:hypothetical protein
MDVHAQVHEREGERESVCVSVCMALKHEYLTKPTVRLKKCYPKASQTKGFVIDLWSFRQNLMQTCCSILPSITDKPKHKVEKTLV